MVTMEIELDTLMGGASQWWSELWAREKGRTVK